MQTYNVSNDFLLRKN